MKPKKFLSFIGIILGMSISMLVQTQLVTAMPIISEEFQTTKYYSLVYSSYLLASTVTLPLFGKISDRYGYRINYLAGGCLFGFGTLLSGFSKSMFTLIFSRVLSGLGSGIAVPSAYGILSCLFAKEQMRKVFGIFTVFQIINNGLGSVLGGYLSTHYTWRFGLFILVPFELVGLILVIMTIPPNHNLHTHTTIRFSSAFLMSLALLTTMLGLEKCSSSSSMKLSHLLLLLGGILLLLLFLLWEQKIENGILPKEILDNKKLRALLLEILFLGAVLNICIAYLPTYMVKTFLWTTNTAGKMMVCYILAMGISSVAASFIKKDTQTLICFSWCIFLLGCLLGFYSYFKHSVLLFLICNLLLGVGVGILTGTLLGVIQSEIKSSYAGTNGIAHLLRNTGGTLGVCALQISLTRGMSFLFIGLIVFSFISLCIQLYIKRRF